MAISKTNRAKLTVIRRHVAAGRCRQAVRAYWKLPESVRWDDSLGPFRAKINACSRRVAVASSGWKARR